MAASNIIQIVLAEALLVSLLGLIVLAVHARQLRLRLGVLESEKMSGTRLEPTSYADMIDQQIALTRRRHEQLGAGGDIALDLDPEAPPERRCAALRQAFLIAEKEASAGDSKQLNWQLLMRRYEQLLAYENDYRQPKVDKRATEGDPD